MAGSIRTIWLLRRRLLTSTSGVRVIKFQRIVVVYERIGEPSDALSNLVRKHKRRTEAPKRVYNHYRNSGTRSPAKKGRGGHHSGPAFLSTTSLGPYHLGRRRIPGQSYPLDLYLKQACCPLR